MLNIPQQPGLEYIKNARRFLMLDLSNGPAFKGVSAVELYELAKKTKSSYFPPPLMSSDTVVNVEAMRWSIKRITENNPCVLFFDSIADAGSPASTERILAVSTMSEWAVEATVKIQQIMLYLLNSAESILGWGPNFHYAHRISARMVELRRIEGFNFFEAIELMGGNIGKIELTNGDMKPGDEDLVVRSYRKITKDSNNYIAFTNEAMSRFFDKNKDSPGVIAYRESGRPLVLGVSHAYEALFSIAHRDYIKFVNKKHKVLDGVEDTEENKIVKESMLKCPFIELELAGFKLGDRIFKASTDGITSGIRFSQDANKN
jgi:hypothetical protein